MPMTNNRKAFTLIELLLAVTLFSIVSLSLYVTFANGLNLDREAERVEGSYGEAGWVMRALEKDLERLISFYSSTSDGEDLLALEGKEDQCAWIIETEEGLKQVAYYLKEPSYDHIHKVIVGKVSLPDEIVVSSEEEHRTKHLVREERAVFALKADNGEDASSEIEIIARFVEADTFSLAYAKLEGKGGESSFSWVGQWQERYPPAGLRIQMRTGEEAEASSPLIVRDILIPMGLWGEKVF